MAKDVRRVSGLPPFETSSSPWFGPIKRAAEMLDDGATVVDPVAALRSFKDVLGGSFAGIEHVRFVDCVRRDRGNRRFTIAICWTRPDAEVRDKLYLRAGEIVARTGWYPLPQGTRLGSVRLERQFGSPGDSFEAGGTPHSIQAAVRPEGGCSVRLTLTGGEAILLDTGLPGHLDVQPQDVAAFISHVHMDHAGGLASGRLSDQTMVIAGDTTFQLLEDRGVSLASSRVQGVRPGQVLRLNDEAELEFFAVPHMPGALGCVARGGGHSLLFPGDLCLRTERHDFIEQLCEMVGSENGNMTVLLDATMAGRPFGAGLGSPATAALKSEGTDLVVVGGDPEQLLYAYLDLFHTVQGGSLRHSVCFLVSGGLRPLFRQLHSAFIRRSHLELDPFLLGQYGSSMSAWGESRWLFWLDGLHSPPEGRRIWFVTPEELDRVPSTSSVEFVAIGRESVADMARSRGMSQLTACDTTPWTLHSDDESLRVGVEALVEAGAAVVLFHNFSKRLKKWIRAHGLRATALSSSSDIGLASLDSSR